jgi:cell division protein FtsN
MAAMREMHKWKDKVELSLDNRQIFFLFFGLSVVGCFVFALGVMVGRRVDFGQTGEVAALANDGLDLLREGEGEQDEPPEALSFKDGLATPATDDVPATRDPSEPPASEEEIAAAKADKTDKAKADKAKADKTDKAKTDKAKADKAKADTVLAKTSSGTAKPSASSAGKSRFTLQMKAFSRAEEAESFAAPLRANGHDVRVEAEEVKGRIWHRVRMGAFDEWETGLAAKDAFEAKEDIIAYVVRM